MLDAYASVGMPVIYRHWTFGKQFTRDETQLPQGYMGLAYEIVINSNPCISYLMEENTMTMQALVIAHAAFGHNNFFKGNYLFQQWTDADGIIDYLVFAKDYIARCEERYGIDAVEGCSMRPRADGPRRRPLSPAPQAEPRGRGAARAEERLRAPARRRYNDLWRTLPDEAQERKRRSRRDGAGPAQAWPAAGEPALFHREELAALKPWQREMVRIVRKIAQYFYPQRQTKVMNEGCATFVHYHILNRLYDHGQLTDGAMLEFLSSHTNVVFQPDFDDRALFRPQPLRARLRHDVRHQAHRDRADGGRPRMVAGDRRQRRLMGTLKTVWANYRDESFIAQYLSPKLMRKMRLFKLADQSEAPHYLVDAIHDERGYARVRRALARQYDPGERDPNIQVSDVDLKGSRRLVLTHNLHNDVPLAEDNARAVLGYVADLWGYDVQLLGIGANDVTKYQYDASPRG